MTLFTALLRELKSYAKKPRKPSNYFLMDFMESFKNKHHFSQLQFSKHRDLKSKFFS